MRNTNLVLLILCLLASSCGQRSEIRNAVESESLASVYGDGKHVIRSLTFPLSDSSLAYQTPLPGLGPIAGGILKFVSDVFAANTKMGKLQMSYTQPIPVLPDELHSVRLKRFFFYMKPSGKQRRFRDWFSRVVMGKGHVTFDFLDKLAVKFESIKMQNVEVYVPTLEIRDYNRVEMRSLMEIFSKNYRPQVVDPELSKDMVLIRYSGDDKNSDNISKKYGNIHIMETSHAREVKHFLMDQMILKGLVKRILILEDSLLIELQKDPIAEESFKLVLSEFAEELDEKFEVTFIDKCTPQSCLELKVPDVNLIPIAKKGNAIKLEGVIHAAKVPESFKLKGFVEFEVKVRTPRGI